MLLLTGCGDATSISVPPADSSPPDQTDVMNALQIGSTSAPQDSQPVVPDTPDVPTPGENDSPTEAPAQTPEPTATPEPTPEPTPFVPLRDNTPYCPTPVASGAVTYGNDVTTIDVSNAGDGYIMANYTGTCPKVKLQIIGPGSYKCTYNLNTAAYQAFPLTGGNGSYTITVNENIVGNEYSISYELDLDVSISDPFSPYLTPSSYVSYNSRTAAVELAAQLCETAADDLDCVTAVYNYVIDNIAYDYDKAGQITSGALSSYIADIDGTLSSGKGICLDYAALMACMLRTQHIPTRLEVGYAGLAYHAWISVFIKDAGWVNGIVEFDGSSWSLMDPTFAATNSEDDLKEFIGDGTNYSVRYIY